MEVLRARAWENICTFRTQKGERNQQKLQTKYNPTVKSSHTSSSRGISVVSNIFFYRKSLKICLTNVWFISTYDITQRPLVMSLFSNFAFRNKILYSLYDSRKYDLSQRIMSTESVFVSANGGIGILTSSNEMHVFDRSVAAEKKSIKKSKQTKTTQPFSNKTILILILQRNKKNSEKV